MSKRAQLPRKHFRVGYTYHGPDRDYKYAITVSAVDVEDARRIVEESFRRDAMPNAEVTDVRLSNSFTAGAELKLRSAATGELPLQRDGDSSREAVASPDIFS